MRGPPRSTVTCRSTARAGSCRATPSGHRACCASLKRRCRCVARAGDHQIDGAKLALGHAYGGRISVLRHVDGRQREGLTAEKGFPALRDDVAPGPLAAARANPVGAPVRAGLRAPARTPSRRRALGTPRFFLLASRRPWRFSKLQKIGNPVLRKRARAISPGEIGSPELERLIDDMVETMRAEDGIGIAAPQVGPVAPVGGNRGRRGFVALSPTKLPFGSRCFINPVITVLEPEEQGFWEGCLSGARPARCRVPALYRPGRIP